MSLVNIDPWAILLTHPTNRACDRRFVVKGKRKRNRKRSDLVGITGLYAFKSMKTEKKTNKRKTRRTRSVVLYRKLPGFERKTIGTSTVALQCPDNLLMIQECVVNTLSTILPVEGRANIFGSWHAIILVGVFYRYGNLTWIILNRANCELYISSHFVADAVHLFKMIRGNLNLEERQKKCKWHRQGFNDIGCIYRTQIDYVQNLAFPLKNFPPSILQFSPSPYALKSGQEFLKGGGTTGKFITRFKRQAPAPPGFNPVIDHLVDKTRGWKVFNNTVNGYCIEKARRTCPHKHFVRQLDVVKGLTLAEASPHIMSRVPSSLQKKALALINHYAPFITYVKANPNILFFPTGDVQM
jgi:hypothetical protein